MQPPRRMNLSFAMVKGGVCALLTRPRFVAYSSDDTNTGKSDLDDFVHRSDYGRPLAHAGLDESSVELKFLLQTLVT